MHNIFGNFLNEDDTVHDHTQPNDQHSWWCYEIAMVIEKLQAKYHFK